MNSDIPVGLDRYVGCMAGEYPGRRVQRRPIRGPVAVILTLAAGLSACSNGEPTATADRPKPTPTTAPAGAGAGAEAGAQVGAGSGAPTAPAAKPTTKSAEAFVRYFWDVYNYSYQALDPGPLSSISTPACTFCKSTLNEISGLKNARKYATGGDIRARGVAAAAGDPSKGLIVTMTLNQEPGKTLNGDGTVISSLRAAHNIHSEVAVLWQTSKWMVYGVANDEKTGTS
jgi:uncharacterized protein DUF6318